MKFNLQTNGTDTFDAIVIGSGISGGMAAKELCEKGLKTLVLERGRKVEHVKDYTTAYKAPWQLPNRGQTPQSEIEEHYEKQSRTGYTVREAHKHWFVKDSEHPYQEVKRFDWMRGYHVGGRSIMWGRHSYRWSAMDFEANAKDGFGVDWPVRYDEIAPWYDYVEGIVGIHGMKENLAQLPDGNFLPPMELNCVENKLRDDVKSKLGYTVTIGRTANLSVAHKGRSACQYRNLCIRGCPYGAYFSSLSSTLPSAAATGNLTLRPNSIVYEILYDKDNKRATGVRVIDTETKEDIVFNAKIIFGCASAIGTTQILMNSISDAFPEGFGNQSGELGHNIMDHHFRCGANAEVEGFDDKYYSGRRPTGFYIPRFRNLDKATTSKDYVRGFGYQGGAGRGGWQHAVKELGVGVELKENLQHPGAWRIGMTGFAETLPYHENKMTLDRDNLDQWGLPTVIFDAEFKENERKMRADMMNDAAAMLEAAGFKNVRTYDSESYPGLGIHEMGTARMGRDRKTSVVNKYNQVWDAKNVFLTDGSFMTSAACQNPSLTYMAFTARAVDYAVKELNKQNL
ncbi:MAG: GMC family oxidoreductase [Bacteroidota bacterium]